MARVVVAWLVWVPLGVAAWGPGGLGKLLGSAWGPGGLGELLGSALSDLGLVGPVAGDYNTNDPADRELISILAACSKDVYNDKSKTSRYKAHWIEKKDLWTLPDISAATYKILQGHHKGKIVLAYKGADIRNLAQIKQAVATVFGNVGAIKDAIQSARGIASRERPDFVTGHSLGGLLAECVTSYEQIPGANFGSPGPWGSFGNSATTLTGDAFDGVKFKVVMNSQDMVGRAVGNAGGSQSSHIVKSTNIWWLKYDAARAGHHFDGYCENVGELS